MGMNLKCYKFLLIILVDDSLCGKYSMETKVSDLQLDRPGLKQHLFPLELYDIKQVICVF